MRGRQETLLSLSKRTALILGNERIDIRDFPIGRNHRDEHFWPRATLLHELGHVMGMEHADTGVTNNRAYITELTEGEAREAAELLGCR